MTDRSWDQGSFDSTHFNIPLSREMEERPFYTVCLTPDLSSRLYETMCSDRMEQYGNILLAKIMCVGTLWLYFRNAWRETIIESLRFLKCVLSFISFVKISLGLIMSVICSTSTSFDWCHSRTIFYRMFRCLITFEVNEDAHWTAALLSLYILVREYASGIPISLARYFSDWISVAHLLVAMISASQELNDVWFWWIYFHTIGPPDRQMRKPERERNLNSSRGVLSSTALPNLPSQLALQKSVSWWHSDG